ncbi:MAG: BamA/TamA family outer membrane protein, partial [Aestuariivirga sp.]|nr:BamA/TamA family outer membrane protein [Aestuariivirga sp.]
NNEDESSYTAEQWGFLLRGGFRLDDESNLSLRYGLTWRSIQNITKSSASPAVIETEGVTLKSYVGAVYTWDNLDNPNRPTNGFRGQLIGEVAGLGGDVYFGSVEARGWYFIPLYEDSIVLKLEANAGHVQPLGGDGVPLQDRFFKGADTFRGFAVSGVGPRQGSNDGDTDAIGGRTYAIGTVELSFPVFLPEEWGIEGSVFSDFGTVFNSGVDSEAAGQGDCSYGENVTASGPGCEVFDTADIRMSVGAGIIWQSPFGPLRFEAAYPLLKTDYDETEWFRFSVGTRF